MTGQEKITLKIERFCIVCDKDVAADTDEDAFSYPPSGATAWQSSGNYGTELFDPMSGNEYIECFVCDDCLRAKSHRVYHVKTEKEIKHTFHSFANQLAKEKQEQENLLKGLTP